MRSGASCRAGAPGGQQRRDHPEARDGDPAASSRPGPQCACLSGSCAPSPCLPCPYHCTVATLRSCCSTYSPLPDPEAIRLWQQAVSESAGVTGRIIVSPHGINATVGGDISAVKQYVRATRKYAPFSGADIKWSEGTGTDFPRLSVRVRPEIVTFGVPDELEVDESGVVGGAST